MDHEAQHDQLGGSTEDRAEHDGAHYCDDHREGQLDGEFVVGVATGHDEGTLAEVEYTGAAVDEYQALSDEGVDRARSEAEEGEPNDIHGTHQSEAGPPVRV